MYPTSPPRLTVWNQELEVFQQGPSRNYYWRAYPVTTPRGTQTPGWYYAREAQTAKTYSQLSVQELRELLPLSAFIPEPPAEESDEAQATITEVEPSTPRPTTGEENSQLQSPPPTSETLPRTEPPASPSPAGPSNSANPQPASLHQVIQPTQQSTGTNPIRSQQMSAQTGATVATQAKEILTGKPKEFRGDTDKHYARRFLSACNDYLSLNAHVYDTPIKQTIFFLSFFQEGPAGTWATNLSEAAKVAGGSYPRWAVLQDTFKKKFISDDDTADAIRELQTTLKQGTKTAADFNNEFQAAASRSGVKEFQVLKGYYENAINKPLLQKIYNQGQAPTTMDEYYTQARAHDDLFRRMKSIQPSENQPRLSQRFNRFRQTQNYQNPSTNTNYNSTYPSAHPPKLTPEERARCIEQRLCFKCRQPNHTSDNCPKYPRGQQQRNIRATAPAPNPYYAPIYTYPQQTQMPYLGPQYQPMPQYQPAPPPAVSKPTPAEQAAHVRAIIASLPENQREDFFNSLDNEGF